MRSELLDHLHRDRANATTVSPVSPRSASSSTSRCSNSCGTCISQLTISSAVASPKQSSQWPKPLSPSGDSVRTGGPNTRHVIGRHSYKSHRPVSGSSAGQAASLAYSAKRSRSSSDSPSRPESRSPGNSAPNLSNQSAVRRSTSAAKGGLSRRSTSMPSRSRSASSWFMANAPKQHCVHPDRQSSHTPARRAASANAASMICTSSLSPCGRAIFIRIPNLPTTQFRLVPVPNKPGARYAPQAL